MIRPAALTSLAMALMLAACGDSDAPAPAPQPQTHGGAPETTATPQEAAAILATLGEPYASANLDNGRRLFRRCASCHTLGSGERHLVGPNLHGMFGREAGGAEGFRFSRALEQADFVWTKAELDEWLANPRTYLPGNRMSFAGLRNDADRNDLIAFLAVETRR
ncbi:cytochrome c family protein [Glycocaulis abyssi]|uniref:Cytochrome c family protein n=1 Tax=Glycocaulis abyssi TaxID=1433403 RepID=A0ABV9NAC2_9PROT